MKLFTSNRGAVSVFLVIILVPTLIVTSIFVDVSRMFLSKSVAESAADLALNSQLSQFDEELNEMYGLFAHAQSVDDVSTNLNKYFESCMVSSGVETTDAKKYGQILTDLIDEEMGDEYSDLLQISSVDDPSITPVPDGNLDNPQILKNQIVSFMKYRGPINIVEGFIGDLTKVKDQVDIVDEETEITDKMSEHYETQGNVLEQLKEAYFEIKDYKRDSGMNKDYVNNLKTELLNLEEEYKKNHVKMFKDLYNTQGVYIDTDSYQSIKYFTSYKNCKGTYYCSCKKIKEDMSDETFNQIVKNAQTKVDNFETFYNGYINNFYNKASSNITVKTGTVFTFELKQDIYPIQWYVYMSKNSGNYINNYAKNANNMVHSVACAFYAAEKTGKTSEAYENMINEYKKYALNPNKTSQKIDVDSGIYVSYRYFYPLVTLIKNVYNNNVKNNISTTDVNNSVKNISDYLKGEYSKIKNAKTLVSKAKTYLNKAYEIYTNNKTGIPVTLKNWENSLNNSNLQGKSSSVQKSSQESYDTDTEFKNNVTEESILELKTRIENIETLLQNMLDYIDGVKYNGKKVKDINSYNEFKNNSGINESNIVMNKNNLEANANSSFIFTYPNVDITISEQKNNNPDIETNSPKLYKYLKQKYAGLSRDSNENKQEVKDYKEKKEETKGKETITNEVDDELSTKEIGTGESEEEKISKKISDISKNITGMFGGVSGYINNPASARDDLYVLEYSMNMFSYHTYNKEGLYNQAYKAGKKGLNDLSTVKSLRPKYNDVWTDTQTTFTENKSLTNIMINKENNYSFGNEVEYILNGKSNKANKSAVSGKIYMLRFAFNLGPEFSDNWNDTELNSLAGTINTLCPYIPATLVKVVTILGLTAAEAAHDLKCLKEGMKVQLVKPKDELVFTRDKNSDSVTLKPASEIKGMQYSDYLYLFLFLDLVNENKENTVISRMGDVIARNVGMRKGYDNESQILDLSKSHTYYTFNGKVQVKPLLLSVPLFNDETYNKSDTFSWWQWDYTVTRGYN